MRTPERAAGESSSPVDIANVANDSQELDEDDSHDEADLISDDEPLVDDDDDDDDDDDESDDTHAPDDDEPSPRPPAGAQRNTSHLAASQTSGEDLLDLSSLVVGIQSDKPALPGAPPGGPGAPPGPPP